MVRSNFVRRVAAAVGAAALVAVGTALPAAADTKPVDPADPDTPVTVSTDPLPTVQIDGVVWDQVVVGNTVYAAGKFTTARPAGAAPGQNTVVRNNLLAFDIRTGELISSFAPSLDGQARGITRSPDGKRVYVTGDFNKVDGVYHVRVAAIDTATNKVVAGFKPTLASAGLTIAASNTTVYVGGNFKSVASTTGGTLVPRMYLAALDAQTGALTSFQADANAPVTSLAYSPATDKVFVGGRFTTIGGQSYYGLASVHPTTGDVIPLPANSTIRNAGTTAAILDLNVLGDKVYGTGYHYGDGGNVEGVFKLDAPTGAVEWVADCHGDGYSSFTANSVVYLVTHEHYCGNMGGFPQTDPWTIHYGTAFTDHATGVNTPDIYGYPHHAGEPAPSLLTWYPDLISGSYTGQGQAGWSVTGNDDYVVFGGEFPGVNNRGQQGLVRFATPDKAPNKMGPLTEDVEGNPWRASASSRVSGLARVTFPTTWDRDNETLTYKVYRGSTATTPIFTETITAKFWLPVTRSVNDPGRTPGSTQTYIVTATDPWGNVAQAPPVSVTISATGSLSDYSAAVYDDGATGYWRLGEASGSTVEDWAGTSDAIAQSGVTRGAAGAITGDADTASRFSGTSSGYASTQTRIPGPQTFSIEAWFRTTTKNGGKIVGFGNNRTGNSTSYDRHVYMDTNGRLLFGVYPGSSQTLQSAKAYNDNEWHHVVATLGSGGMQLFVDGSRVGRRSDVTSAQSYSGYWRIGGDTPWTAQGYFNGQIDEVAVYPSALTPAQVDEHWVASGRASAVPAAPADAYGAAVFGLSPDLYWRLGEATGTTAADSGPWGNTGSYKGTVTRSVASGVQVPAGNVGVSFSGAANALVSATGAVVNPTTYSQELWFRTTSTAGGKLIGFGDATSGLSSNYDRHVYMETDGTLTFGVWTGEASTITTPGSFNDGTWHHLVATQSSAGMRLYVDGVLQGTNPQTGAQAYTGYWRIGGDNTWGPQPWFAGAIDEVAVYPVALTAQQVAQHYTLGSGTVPNQAPTASFTSSVEDLTVHLTSTASDPDGTVASHLWTFDDGTTSTLANPTHEFATAGEHVVTLKVTDDDGASDTASATVTTTLPNQAPTAAFDATVDHLVVSVDAAGSSDPDGEVVSYRWTFDGEVSSQDGATATFTAATAGPHTVSLVVTDDDGATSAPVTTTVTTTAPPVNQAPTAAFAWEASDLTVSVDGSGSSDPDGTVASYRWTFDGAVAGGSGATASHTFTTEGEHTVTLVVTDDDGLASAPVSQTVTVTAPTGPQQLALDTFTRTTTSGWGSAETGGAWTLAGSASLFKATGSAGTVTVNAGSTPKARLDGAAGGDVDVTAKVALDKLSSSGTVTAWVSARMGTGWTSEYALNTRFSQTGVLTVQLLRRLSTGETVLASSTVSGVTYAPGTQLKIRLQADGSGTTALRGRVWTSATEPTTWQVTANDSTAELQDAGGVGIGQYAAASTPNGPITYTWDDVSSLELD